MLKVDLQNRTEAEKGILESYWFENPNIGLEKTLFHKIIIPLKPFNTDLSVSEEAEKTAILLDWYELKLCDSQLDGLNLAHSLYPEAEGSIYLGGAHNWCDVKQLTFSKQGDSFYRVTGELIIEFENEGVAQNEVFSFSTLLKDIGLTSHS